MGRFASLLLNAASGRRDCDRGFIRFGRDLSVDYRDGKAARARCNLADEGGTVLYGVGTAWALVGWGLFRLHNWARWTAMLVMTIGIAWLVPKISMAEVGVPILWSGLQIALRAAAAWYLAQAPAVIDSFARKS